MAPRGLSSGPDAPLGASPESSPAVRESVSAPHDARAEFLDIVAHMDTPGVTESTTAIEAALTAAPSDAVRAAILAEISVNAGEIQMSVGDNQVLIDLVKKILSHAI